MYKNEVITILREGAKPDKIRAIRQAAGTLDREVLNALSELYFTTDDEDIKEEIRKAIIKSAEEYAKRFLRTYFFIIPWDTSVVIDEATFKKLYQVAEEHTHKFSVVDKDTIMRVLRSEPRTVIVFRMILGYTAGELAFMLQEHYGEKIRKDDISVVEHLGNNAPRTSLRRFMRAVPSMADFIYRAVKGEIPELPEGIDTALFRPRTYKIDTREGWESVEKAAKEGVSYADLLYQRYIGGAFRQVRDMSSSIKGDVLQGPLEKLFKEHGIPYYHTKPRERIPNWELAPDFFIPNTMSPEVVIEAKVTEDGGTARDKASRIEKLARIAREKGVILIAVVDGKGFTRIRDALAPIILNSGGLVFSYSNLHEILDVPAIAKYKGKATGLS